MSLPALEDIAATEAPPIRSIRGPHRDVSPEKATPIIMEMMRSVYPHDESSASTSR